MTPTDVEKIKNAEAEAEAEAKGKKSVEEIEEPEEKGARAHDLKSHLGGSFKERMEETKTIHVKLSGTGPMEVDFGGWWNGHLVNKALNSISRAYRLRRHKQVRPNRGVPNATGGSTDEKAN